MDYRREIIKTIKALEKELGHEIVSGDRKLKLYDDLESIATKEQGKPAWVTEAENRELRANPPIYRKK